jgi:rhodanese-related sulfurtransferase
VAQTFLNHGFKEVFPLIGGFNAWHQAKLPVEPKNKVQKELSYGKHSNT